MYCKLCNKTLASSREGLETHLKRFHAVTPLQLVPIDPHIKSGIVSRVETRLKRFIVDGTIIPDTPTVARAKLILKQAEHTLMKTDDGAMITELNLMIHNLKRTIRLGR